MNIRIDVTNAAGPGECEMTHYIERDYPGHFVESGTLKMTSSEAANYRSMLSSNDDHFVGVNFV